MPLYDLVCDCGHTKEQMLKLDEKEPLCDKCGLRMRKAMSTPAFHLHGKWWASDNYGLKKAVKTEKNKKS